MEKLEAVVLIVIVLLGLVAMYYFLAPGAGQAVKYGYCEGRIMRTVRINSESSYDFAAIHGKIKLIDIRGETAKLLIDDMLETPYLGLGDSWRSSDSPVALQIGDISGTMAYVCLASNVPDTCQDYQWDELTGQRTCIRWLSQADIYKYT